MIYILSAIIFVLIAYTWDQFHLMHKLREKGANDVQWTVEFYSKWFQSKEQEWKEERQQLLDRIQAPTFAEFKHQEAKIIKAKNGTDKPDIVIEQL